MSQGARPIGWLAPSVYRTASSIPWAHAHVTGLACAVTLVGLRRTPPDPAGLALALAIALLLLVASAEPAFAHGFGQREDLPLTLAFYVWGPGRRSQMSPRINGTAIRSTPFGLIRPIVP